MRTTSLRRTGLSLAVTLALGIGHESQAATITVNDAGDCTLAQAIEAANGDGAVGGCIAGSGADTIVLPNSTYFTALPLPVLRSDVTLRGGGVGVSAINCENGGQLFVIGDESSAPVVTLRSFGIQSCTYTAGGGQLGGGGGGGLGGSILVHDGIVSLQRMSVSNASVQGGPGSTTMFGSGAGGGGGLHGAGAGAGTTSQDAFGIGSGGGGGGVPSSGAANPGGAAGAPNGGLGGTGGIITAPPTDGGFGGGGGGGAGLTGNQGGQTGAAGGFGGGGGGGGSVSTTTTSAFAGRGGPGGFGGGGGAGGGAPLPGANAGDGGEGGFGGGGGGQGYNEGGAAVTPGKSGFGAESAVGGQGGHGAALGAALFVRAGLVTIENTSFNNNSALGSAGSRLGGAIFVIDQAASDAHLGNRQGMPAQLAEIGGCSVSFSGNVAASHAGTDTNNADVYGASRNALIDPCKDIFMDGFE